MIRCVHIIVSGQVQGVFYRAFTEEVALRLGLKGTAQNLPDGTVEIFAEGEEELLRQLITKLNRGSPFSRVSDVDVEWLPARSEFKDFRRI